MGKNNLKIAGVFKDTQKPFILSNQAKNSHKVNNKTIIKKLNKDKLKDLLSNKDHQIKMKNKLGNKKKSNFNLPLRERMLTQLKSSRFRYINEQLYNTESNESKKYFQKDPDSFFAYHEGYKQQISHWPLNPLDIIIDAIKKLPKEKVIADFGCGEARLSESVPHAVHSFDLVAMNEKVTACDMAHTPLLTGSVHVVVFCLSLMGTNLKDYLLEANRVLAHNGMMMVAEVESRFEKIEDFIRVVCQYGFSNTKADLSHNIFYFMDFKKTKEVDRKNAKKLPVPVLKPCLYKKR